MKLDRTKLKKGMILFLNQDITAHDLLGNNDPTVFGKEGAVCFLVSTEVYTDIVAMNPPGRECVRVRFGVRHYETWSVAMDWLDLTPSKKPNILYNIDLIIHYIDSYQDDIEYLTEELDSTEDERNTYLSVFDEMDIDLNIVYGIHRGTICPICLKSHDKYDHSRCRADQEYGWRGKYLSLVLQQYEMAVRINNGLEMDDGGVILDLEGQMLVELSRLGFREEEVKHIRDTIHETKIEVEDKVVKLDQPDDQEIY